METENICYSNRAEQVLRMAASIAKSYNGRCVEVEDLAAAVARVQELIKSSPVKK